MFITQKQSELKLHLQSIASGKSIGFVPTMGALHEGHMALVKKSFQENFVTVVSIFVNPTQFNNLSDLEKYPRTLESDVEKIAVISDKIIVYTPTVDDIYSGKTISEKFNFEGLENKMEGKFRPGHFDGVGTVVKKLFEIVCPTNAYFGEKDFQQTLIIKKLIEITKLPVNIIVCPIYREKNGLAMSSRNARLTSIEKENASIIYKTLKATQQKFAKGSASDVEKWVKKVFSASTDFRLEYFTIANEKNLDPCIRKSKKQHYRAFIAVFAGEVRLIDTLSL
jgi:pantoate--beta-alanine ligase